MKLIKVMTKTVMLSHTKPYLLSNNPRLNIKIDKSKT